MEYVTFGDDAGATEKLDAIWGRYSAMVTPTQKRKAITTLRGSTYAQDVEIAMKRILVWATTAAKYYANPEGKNYQMYLTLTFAILTALFDKYKIGVPGDPKRFEQFASLHPEDASKIAQLMEVFVKVAMVHLAPTSVKIDSQDPVQKILIPTASLFTTDKSVLDYVSKMTTSPVPQTSGATASSSSSGGSSGGSSASSSGSSGGSAGAGKQPAASETSPTGEKSNAGLMVGIGVAALAAYFAFKG